MLNGVKRIPMETPKRSVRLIAISSEVPILNHDRARDARRQVMQNLDTCHKVRRRSIAAAPAHTWQREPNAGFCINEPFRLLGVTSGKRREAMKLGRPRGLSPHPFNDIDFARSWCERDTASPQQLVDVLA